EQLIECAAFVAPVQHLLTRSGCPGLMGIMAICPGACYPLPSVKRARLRFHAREGAATFVGPASDAWGGNSLGLLGHPSGQAPTGTNALAGDVTGGRSH